MSSAFPFLGVIEPGARVAAQETKNKKVGVIGTEGTIEAGSMRLFSEAWIRRSL